MSNNTALTVRDLECAYGSVRVLSGISFELEAGSILGIAGENGAGKSTLVKSICGLLKPVRGSVERAVPATAIHQEFNLAPHLTVAENLFLGMEMESVAIYSFLYNGLYMIPTIICALIVAPVLYAALERMLPAKKI